MVDKVDVIVVVEESGSLEVQWGEVVVSGAHFDRAAPLPCLGEGSVDVGLVVDAGSKDDTPCLPYCVRSW